MCTAVSLNKEGHYFGRNLDYEYTFGEKICVTPRNFKLEFSNEEVLKSHYAIIGVAKVEKNHPLYFDGMNEKGLCMAGLNFPGFCRYNKVQAGKNNIASYDFILWVLSKCESLENAKKLCANLNITDKAFKENMQPSPLHWIIADKTGSVVVEQTENGLMLYNNPVGVLANSPSFDMQMFNLNNYMHISPDEPENTFGTELKTYSRGMGALGLPGDNSSMSRFVRASFHNLNSVQGEDAVNQLFHILYSVYQVRGSVKVGDKFEITNYTSVCDCERRIYYFTTYDNLNLNFVCLYNANLDGDKLEVCELYRN